MDVSILVPWPSPSRFSNSVQAVVRADPIQGEVRVLKNPVIMITGCR